MVYKMRELEFVFYVVLLQILNHLPFLLLSVFFLYGVLPVKPFSSGVL